MEETLATTATRRHRLLVSAVVLALALGAMGASDPAHSQRPDDRGLPVLAGAVGIRVTVADVRPALGEADLDLTMYTRVGPYPSTVAGVSFVGIPALDYGDGATLSTTTLVLASSGGGPGGSNVYRNLASFTHTYAAPGFYTVTAGSYCTFCFRSSYAFFPPGSPVPTTYSNFFDYLPATVIGNLAAHYVYTGTTTTPFFDYSVRYHVDVYAAVTNTAQLTVDAPPLFAKAFSPQAIGAGGISALTLTIDHTAGTMDATGLDFTDVLPAGVLIANPPNAATSCAGGTLTAAAGTDTITYTGGTVAAGTTCSISVAVTAGAAGSYVNTTGNLTSSAGDSGTASDTLDVVPNPPPVLSKTFVPATIGAGGISTLALTIDHGAGTTDVTGLDVTDVLPTGMLVANPANAATTCIGGALTATPGTDTITYTGGTVAAGTSCSISVDVTAAGAAGSYVNTTGNLTSSAGDSGTATATLELMASVLEIPTLRWWGLLALGGLLVLSGFGLLRRL